MARRDTREPRSTLPGIADIRITADEATTAIVLDVLRTQFIATSVSRRYTSGNTYVQLDAGCTDPDPD
ncbi:MULTISPECIES: hypothetical protein [Streptomyces]|uniref:hypothetical protein n=1 Tax=Streptomyces TaxID=1883 RepID=UPI0004BE1566|nr:MULTISPECIES: hypothetical protein [Streptomyces]KUJ68086.1 hypothetical protein ACZ90_22260 [Streptomyces albus subsp. albus]